MSQQQEDLISKLVTAVTDWHKDKIDTINSILDTPAGKTSIQLGTEEDPILLVGDRATGFRMGLMVCKEWIGKLPFEATKNESHTSHELGDEPDVQHVYLFTEDLGDGSNAVRYTQDPDLLKRLQSDGNEYSDYFQQNEGYSRTLTFPADIDLDACGFDFYQE